MVIDGWKEVIMNNSKLFTVSCQHHW